MQILQSRSGKRRSPWRRRLAWILVLLLAAAGWLGWQPAHDALSLKYRMWKQRHALAQAHEFLQKQDLPDAEIALHVAMVEAKISSSRRVIRSSTSCCAARALA